MILALFQSKNSTEIIQTAIRIRRIRRMIFDVLKKKKQMLIITVCFSLEVIFTQFMNCLAWDNPSLYWGKQSTDLLMAVVIISFYSFADIKKRKALYLSKNAKFLKIIGRKFV